MCAHPAYSETVVDYTKGRVDFMPRFTCEQSRQPGTICGPEGRLFVEDTPASVVSINGRDLLRKFGNILLGVWAVAFWLLALYGVYFIFSWIIL
jgi:hypothetical protein